MSRHTDDGCFTVQAASPVRFESPLLVWNLFVLFRILCQSPWYNRNLVTPLGVKHQVTYYVYFDNWSDLSFCKLFVLFHSMRKQKAVFACVHPQETKEPSYLLGIFQKLVRLIFLEAFCFIPCNYFTRCENQKQCLRACIRSVLLPQSEIIISPETHRRLIPWGRSLTTRDLNGQHQ